MLFLFCCSGDSLFATAEKPEKKGVDKAMNKNKKKSRFRQYLEKKGISLSPKVYFIDAMGAMAMGLFVSLLISTIFSTLADWTGLMLLEKAASYCQAVTGAALGVSIAYALKAPPLILFSAAAVGYAGNAIGGTFLLDGAEKALTAGPAGAFIAVLVAVEIGKLVSKTTPVDILVTPTVTILSGVGIALLICPAIAYVMYWIGTFVNTATELRPLLMGVIVSVVVGVVLTLPISSAALCAMIGISGCAGGAAVAGCCAQMIGFAVISFRENGWGGLLAQGLGTSMLQMGNICRKPAIWIAPTLAAAVTGPVSTLIFRLECNGVSAGMGTCGLVGPLGILSAMSGTENGGLKMWIGIALVCFILPAVLSLIFNEILRRLGMVSDGDMKLEL